MAGRQVKGVFNYTLMCLKGSGKGKAVFIRTNHLETSTGITLRKKNIGPKTIFEPMTGDHHCIVGKCLRVEPSDLGLSNQRIISTDLRMKY